MNFTPKANLIWNIAELLRGSWKQHEYQDVILPFTVLKRLDSVLEKTKPAVLRELNLLKDKNISPDPILKNITKVGFYNTSEYSFRNLLDEQTHIEKNFREYLRRFSPAIQEIIEKFDFEKHLSRLWGGNLLFQIIQHFNAVDLSPEATDNHEMGSIFEELIRRFAEQSNDTAGEHYTPREVIKLMVEILFAPEKEHLQKAHLVKRIYDPCCGTGGMLTVSKEHILSAINPDISVYLFGQEINPATYAICKSEMLINGEDADNIKGGEKDAAVASTLSNDQFHDKKFDYLLTNPPFGVDWKRDKDAVEREAERGFAGRFGAGLPRISDGQLLFLQHLMSKMQNPSEGGSRMAIVMNGSPLFTGDAGSGESEIRRWILENDWLETIVALPDQMFFNTGIFTYLWFLTNRKDQKRKGKVQLIDARTFFHKMRKSLGNKRNEITDEDRQRAVKEFTAFKESDHCKIFKTTDFAYRQITVERPLRLRFVLNEERTKMFKNHQANLKLGEKRKSASLTGKASDEQQKIINMLDTLIETSPPSFKSRRDFLAALEKTSNKVDLKLRGPILKALIDSYGERDESADICRDEEGNPESDSDLRDTENVPYNQSIKDYFEKEVKPYVADAWINEGVRDHKDGKVGKVGYEIPFTRYFYTYTPPRPLEEIESDLEKVENELLGLLKKL